MTRLPHMSKIYRQDAGIPYTKPQTKKVLSVEEPEKNEKCASVFDQVRYSFYIGFGIAFVEYCCHYFFR